jgi:flagella basal body P-ring formation protein FlgA
MRRIVFSTRQNIRGNRGRFRRQFPTSLRGRLSKVRAVNPRAPTFSLPPPLVALMRRFMHLLAWCWLALPLALVVGVTVALLFSPMSARAQAHVQAQPDVGFVLSEPVLKQVRDLALANDLPKTSQKNNVTGKTRTELVVGQIDGRLRLAACDKVQTYWPYGSRPWGKTRVGLRCMDGPKAWNVSLPLEVKVFGLAWVATGALPSGHVLDAKDVRQGEIDLAAEPSPAISAEEDFSPVGRTLARPMAGGDAVRENHVKTREWFAAGEVVQLKVVGAGFAIGGSGEAMTSGVEGRSVRVKTEGGRVVSGRPVGERLVEIAL